jgi:hypothetical protein
MPTISIHFIRLGTTLHAESVDHAKQTLRDGHCAREFGPWKQGDQSRRVPGVWRDTGARLRYEMDERGPGVEPIAILVEEEPLSDKSG